MHPNFTMSDSEELNIGDFDPSTYQHVLPEGAHDYDDYDSEYEREHQPCEKLYNKQNEK